MARPPRSWRAENARPVLKSDDIADMRRVIVGVVVTSHGLPL